MPQISIIIAMYNIEKYIAQCLNSCINQQGVALEEYEIIVVNDGATDNSLEVAEDVLAGISNARIVTRINGGLSEARNTGLNEAYGEYVWFVDGDDIIAPNAIAILLKNIRESHSDTYLCNYSLYDGNTILNTSHFSKEYSGMSGREIHNNHCCILPMMAWLSINRREFLLLNNLKFYPHILHEDFEFSIRAHHMANSIMIVDDALYLYRVDRAGSIMQQKQKDNSKSIKSYFTIIDSWRLFFYEQKEINTLFYKTICGSWASLLFRMIYGGEQDESTKALIKERWFNCILCLMKGTIKQKCMAVGILLTPNLLLKRFFGRKKTKFI